MKTWFVFGYDSYYPFGGMEDFQASFETVEGAKEYVKVQKTLECPKDYYDIIDISAYQQGEIYGY